MLPDIGPEVVGGSFCPLDGHVNSLRLFRTLHTALNARGATYLPSHRVDDITARGRRVPAHHGARRDPRGQGVLAAGNANMRLAPMVGLDAPMKPERGQIVVTERLRPFLQPSRRHPAPDRRGHGDDRRLQGGERRSEPASRSASAPPRPSARCAMFPLLRQRQRGAHLERDPRHDPGRLPDLRRVRDAIPAPSSSAAIPASRWPPTTRSPSRR